MFKNGKTPREISVLLSDNVQHDWSPVPNRSNNGCGHVDGGGGGDDDDDGSGGGGGGGGGMMTTTTTTTTATCQRAVTAIARYVLIGSLTTPLKIDPPFLRGYLSHVNVWSFFPLSSNP